MANSEALATHIQNAWNSIKPDRRTQKEAVFMGIINGMATMMGSQQASTLIWLMTALKYPELAKKLLNPVEVELNFILKDMADAINIAAEALLADEDKEIRD